MENSQILSIVITIIGSSTLSGIISHFMYNNKLKKELKYKGNDVIAREIAASLKAIRDVVLELSSQEVFNIENRLQQAENYLNLIEGECIYPSIFNDWKSFIDYCNKINKCRIEFEKNISCKLALNLVFIERYLMTLAQFIKNNGDEQALQFWGAIFICDLQPWQRKMDNCLIKEINKNTYKLESHNTKKWEKLRKKELVEQYTNTVLHFLINGHCGENKKKTEQLEEQFRELMTNIQTKE